MAVGLARGMKMALARVWWTTDKHGLVKWTDTPQVGHWHLVASDLRLYLDQWER
jgi:hypothetical protein